MQANLLKWSPLLNSCLYYKELEDTKGVIRIRKSKKNRQHNGQKEKYKKTSNDLQNLHIKLKMSPFLVLSKNISYQSNLF